MKIKLDPGARTPEKAYETDAGWDLFSRETVTLYPGDSHVFDTGVHVALPFGTGGIIVAKSGLNTKHDLTSTGLIDSTYSGAICVKIHNEGREAYTIREGDKISQLVIVQLAWVSALDVVDELDETGRGANGFGSSGR